MTSEVQDRILLGISTCPYADWAAHKDFINLTVPVEVFLDITESEDDSFDPGFNELLVFIEKEWLFEKMRKEGIEDPHKFLCEEYDSENAINWYEDALSARKVAMISFN